MKNSGIAWTDHTFNPWWGCVKVSEGCKHCYAETFAKRTGHNVWGPDAPRRFFGQKHWNEPLKWNAEAGTNRARVFCASMADVFETHKLREYQEKMNSERQRLAWTIANTPNLDWLLLTKRIESAHEYLRDMFGKCLPDNLWIGTTAENQEQYNKRVPILSTIEAVIRFVSIEPQIGPVTMFSNPTTTAISEMVDWIICGGESGPGCRPFDVEWGRELLHDCQEGGTAFFMKQLGGVKDHRHNLEDFPEDLRVREFPYKERIK